MPNQQILVGHTTWFSTLLNSHSLITSHNLPHEASLFLTSNDTQPAPRKPPTRSKYNHRNKKLLGASSRMREGGVEDASPEAAPLGPSHSASSASASGRPAGAWRRCTGGCRAVGRKGKMKAVDGREASCFPGADEKQKKHWKVLESPTPIYQEVEFICRPSPCFPRWSHRFSLQGH